MINNSKNVWTGKPSDQEVYEYGRQMGNVIKIIVGTVGGGGIVGAKIVQALGKVAPKLMKAVDKASDAFKGATKSGADNVADFERYRSSLAAKEIVNAERTGTALSKSDPGHLSASFVSEEQLAAGRTFSIRGGDKVSRTLLQTKGELNGKSGIFEYILEPNGTVAHQCFIQGGIINGVPNQVVK